MQIALRLEELLEAIYENPHDDGPRLVYADALQQAGDPRGEFIALQLAGSAATDRRERALLAKHGGAWLGPIEPIIDRRSAAYRRGFVVTARELPMASPPRLVRDRDRARLRACREWRTVEDLVVGNRDVHATAFLAIPKPALRRVWNVDLWQLGMLAKQGLTLPWTTLGLEALLMKDISPSWQTDLAALSTLLPDLLELDATRVHPLATFFEGLGGLAIAKRLQRVRVRWPTVPDDPQVIVELARKAGIPELELVPKRLGWVRLPHETKQDIVRITGDRITLDYNHAKPNATHAAKLVARLAPGSIRSVDLSGPPGIRFDQPNLAKLRPALAVHKLTKLS